MQVAKFLQQGWRHAQDKPNTKPYFAKKGELSFYDSCILWGTRIVVSVCDRDAVLIKLHEGHPGMARMKSLARMYV